MFPLRVSRTLVAGVEVGITPQEIPGVEILKNSYILRFRNTSLSLHKEILSFTLGISDQV